MQPTASSAATTAATVSVSALSSSAAKEISSLSGSDAVGLVDAALIDYLAGDGGPDFLYTKLVKAVKTKDNAASILPYLVGSCPRGELKSRLNDYYQNFV